MKKEHEFLCPQRQQVQINQEIGESNCIRKKCTM